MPESKQYQIFENFATLKGRSDVLPPRNRLAQRKTDEDFQEGYHKGSKGTFAALLLNLQLAERERLIVDPKTKVLSKWFQYHYKSKNFHNQEWTTPEDVRVANFMIDRALLSILAVSLF